MFYQREPDAILRFGDVIQGFFSSIATLDQPVLDMSTSGLKLDISLPKYSVVLTPCCSIGEQRITLAPLRPVVGTFYDNPYFAEDLTNLNRKMQPLHAIPPRILETLSPEDRRAKMTGESVYTLLHYFVYEANEYFLPYAVNGKTRRDVQTSYYMVDFRDAAPVRCSSVTSGKPAPASVKVLQLTPETRLELRDKIAYYFHRVAQEDAALLALT